MSCVRSDAQQMPFAVCLQRSDVFMAIKWPQGCIWAHGPPKPFNFVQKWPKSSKMAKKRHFCPFWGGIPPLQTPIDPPFWGGVRPLLDPLLGGQNPFICAYTAPQIGGGLSRKRGGHPPSLVYIYYIYKGNSVQKKKSWTEKPSEIEKIPYGERAPILPKTVRFRFRDSSLVKRALKRRFASF